MLVDAIIYLTLSFGLLYVDFIHILWTLKASCPWEYEQLYFLYCLNIHVYF